MSGGGLWPGHQREIGASVSKMALCQGGPPSLPAEGRGDALGYGLWDEEALTKEDPGLEGPELRRPELRRPKPPLGVGDLGCTPRAGAPSTCPQWSSWAFSSSRLPEGHLEPGLPPPKPSSQSPGCMHRVPSQCEGGGDPPVPLSHPGCAGL